MAYQEYKTKNTGFVLEEQFQYKDFIVFFLGFNCTLFEEVVSN